jgi:hypothetical protein
MAAPMAWVTGEIALAAGLEILNGQTLTFPSNGAARFLTTGASLRNHGTVTWEAGNGALVYQGGNIAVTNHSDGLWTYGVGSYSLTSNGGPNPLGSFTFANAGAMQGAGPTSDLFVANTIVFSNTGTITGIDLTIQP